MSSSLSRRSFLARLTVSTAVASTAMGAPAAVAKRDTESGDIDDRAGIVGGEPRRERALQLRLRAAIAERKVPIPLQINNGDEVVYPNRIGNFSKTLPHNDIVQGLLLGEAAVISVLRDQRSIFNETFSGGTFTMFDGTTITV